MVKTSVDPVAPIVQPRIDAITAIIQSRINTIAAMIESILDTVTALVETIARRRGILGHGRCTEDARRRSNQREPCDA